MRSDVTIVSLSREGWTKKKKRREREQVKPVVFGVVDVETTITFKVLQPVQSSPVWCHLTRCPASANLRWTGHPQQPPDETGSGHLQQSTRQHSTAPIHHSASKEQRALKTPGRATLQLWLNQT